MKNFNIEYEDESKDIMIINIDNVRFLANLSSYVDGIYYDCFNLSDSNDDKTYIIKEIRWGGVIGYDVEPAEEKEKVYDFYEMYDKKREQFILRLNDNYYYFDEDDIEMSDSIYIHQIGSYKSLIVRQIKDEKGNVIYYEIE